METRIRTYIAKSITLLSLITVLSCSVSKKQASTSSALDEIQKKHVPDTRTGVFDYTFENGEYILKTSSKAAFKEISQSSLKKRGSVSLLPSADLGADTLAYITLSVANIRSKPGHSQELATQALMGTPIRILEKVGSWYRIQTPDKYIGYAQSSDFVWQKDATEGPQIIFAVPYGFLLEEPKADARHVSDLVFGDLLTLLELGGGFAKVSTPDGRVGFVPNGEVNTLSSFLKDATFDHLDQTASQLLGIPYLWGGTSFKGVDCSGFSRTVFMQHGYYLPRDASQQAMVGDEISLENNYSNLRKGDLLFFGRQQDGKPKVTHVAIYLGDLRFIHSSGMVRYASLNPDSPEYDDFNANRLLMARRINNSPDIQKLNSKTLY